MEQLPQNFIDLLPECTLQQKRAMLVHLNNIIKSEAKATSNHNIDYDQYVEHVKNFVPADNFYEEIIADVKSLGLFKQTDKVVTQWLSRDSREYCFSESKRFKHPPKPIDNYPGISKLLNAVNSDKRTTQNHNAALISVYNSTKSALNFHDDGEKIIDQNSSIATVSFGASRIMEFCRHGPKPHIAEHAFEVAPHDLVIMKPGCQQSLLHNIRKAADSPVSEDEVWRFSVSFRKLTPDTEHDPEISFGEKVDSNNINNQILDTPPKRAILRSVNLIVGDSFSAGLDADKLGRNGRQLVKNLSKGGATINDVCKQLDDFYVNNKHPVAKIFVCVGANNIRHCREKGVKHLKVPLKDLAKQIRLQFPHTRVWFQSIIPFPIQHQFTVQNILEFNDLLYHTCVANKMYYLNVVKYFLGRDGFRNEYLFRSRDNIHPNSSGLIVLAKRYFKLLYSNRFNPYGY